MFERRFSDIHDDVPPLPSEFSTESDSGFMRDQSRSIRLLRSVRRGVRPRNNSAMCMGKQRSEVLETSLGFDTFHD